MATRRKTETRLIGNHEYTATQLGATAGLEGLRRLGGKLSSVLQFMFGSKGESQGALLAAAVAKVVEELEPADLVYFCNLFGDACDVKLDEKRSPRVRAVFDEHFAGNYLELVEWLVFCLELNYKAFFVDARGRIEEALASANQTPATS